MTYCLLLPNQKMMLFYVHEVALLYQVLYGGEIIDRAVSKAILATATNA